MNPSLTQRRLSIPVPRYTGVLYCRFDVLAACVTYTVYFHPHTGLISGTIEPLLALVFRPRAIANGGSVGSCV